MDMDDYEDMTYINYEDTLEKDNSYADGYDVSDFEDEEE